MRLIVAIVVCLGALALPAARATAADPVIAAAGDIACGPGDPSFLAGFGNATRCRQLYTSNLLVNAGLARVLPLGDNQYNSGSLADYRASYDRSWGRVKAITNPVPGNHEPGNASGYFDYFNGPGARTGPAGERGKGYYSYDVGAWHLVALNSNCARVPCSAGSAQVRWLQADLAAHPNVCTVAYWHHPRFSSGHDGNNLFMQAIWRTLYDGDVDVALVGHSHNYERFAPQDANGRRDPARGVREFVVGTGGAFFTGVGAPKPNSEVRQNNTYGVLRLTLHPTSYDWTFTPEAGKRFTDSGSGACHQRGAPLPPPPPPSPAPRPPAPLRVNPRTGAIGSGVVCTIAGTPGGDLLRGTPGNDVICGLGGDDRIRGRDGDDLIVGGAGKDILGGGRGRDRIYGNARRDVIRGQSRGDRLNGGGGPDRIHGNLGNDRLVASTDRHGGDRLFGGRGRDRGWINRGDRFRSVERLFRGKRRIR